MENRGGKSCLWKELENLQKEMKVKAGGAKIKLCSKAASVVGGDVLGEICKVLC